MSKERYLAAQPWEQFLEGAGANRDLWLATNKRAGVSPDVVEWVGSVPGRWHLLVLLEDWCGDAVNTVPWIAALADAAPNLDLRVVGRDANPDLMDAHLTRGSRSIPVVMLLDECYREAAWWGPRPAALQSWVTSEGAELSREDRYREVRRWYARDRGRSTIDEALAMLEGAAALRRSAA